MIRIGAEAGQAVSELTSVNRALGDTMTGSQKMSAGLRKAALPAAAALTAIGVAAISATKAAAEDAAAQEHLAGVLDRVAGASSAQVAATEDWISGISRATGVADDQLRPALEKIVTATGDVSKAQQFLGQALDIAAASGKDLDTVSAAIAKGYTGQTAALEKLVPGLSQAAKESDNFATIMGELGTKTTGAMAAQAETAAGQFQIFQTQVAELQEQLGAALLPVMEAILPIFSSLADFAAQNAGAVQALVAVIAALAAGILVANAVMKAYAAVSAIVKAATVAWTAVQWLLNAALTANPIGLVIVAVAALAAAIVVAYMKSETFRNIVTAALNAVLAAARSLASGFTAVWNAAQSAFDWIVSHWKVALFAFGPIGAAVYLLVTNFDKVKSAGQSAFEAITSAVSGVSSAIYGIVSAVQSLISWLGRIHVPKIDLPGPFSLAVPGAAAPRGPSQLATVAGGTTINVYGAIDPEGTARAIRRVLAESDRRQGRRP